MVTTKKEKGTTERLLPSLVIISVILAFAVGILWQKVADLEGGGATVTKKTTVVNPSAGDAEGAAPAARPTNGKLTEDQVAKLVAVNENDHIRGNKNAKVFLIEYADFECPFCSQFHPTTQQVVDEYGGDVALVYRDFPLDALHPKARPAAIASECVADLAGEDAYWKFVDLIFTDQTGSLADLSATAVKAGVNTSAFESCLDSEKFADQVEADYQAGLASGVTGTPGNIIVNDKGEAWLIPGALPFEQLKVTIDEALQ